MRAAARRLMSEQRERQPRRHRPGRPVAWSRKSNERDEHRPTVKRQNHPFGRTHPFAQHQPFAQRNEGGEAGKAQRGNGHAAHLHGNEKRDPVYGQHDAGDGQYGRAAPVEPGARRGALPAHERIQGRHRKGSASGGDDQGVSLDEFPENAGEAEKYGGDVYGNEGVLACH